jgi:glyoxylase-like metal-dependent hydrolase (beta-lactamase superfamily II)
MTDKSLVLLLSLAACAACTADQPVQEGPYTVHVLADGVFRIEDANDSNPAGVHLNEDGSMAGMNNCSDMYLVVGGEKALLIDLSNAVEWDSTATESLRAIVYDRVGEKELFITVTHRHGDHLGMLPAFAEDPRANFWISEAEFSGTETFPEGRTTSFAERSSLDLGGGFMINTMEVPGHTAHSAVFFLRDKNRVFTGDAIGSGSGVWLFDYESFLTYRRSVDDLIAYLEDPNNDIDPDKLVIHGGHAWQRGMLGELTAQHIYDMRGLIERIGQGTAEAEEISTFIPFLDTNFKYGTATITWNAEAAARYADSIRARSDGFPVSSVPRLGP